MNSTFWFAIVLGGIALAIYFLSSGKDTNALSAEEVQQKIASDTNIVILDVRTNIEYTTGHLPNALLIPVQELNERITELNKFKDKEFIVYCRSGNRSRTATSILTRNGFKAFNMQGGILRWTGDIVK
ncbi:MAG: rhodanese-like domain-containing protein [Ignavibacteriales bacterium]|nr:rhodanese-like domain-containing protein [Ignavibacteriales bacterium]